MDDLKYNGVKPAMKENYHLIWRNFNKFVIQLDRIPSTWEEKTSLYCAFLVRDGKQSATVKSYVSAIKYKLTTDGYPWNDKLVLLSTITKACKIMNDVVLTRLPIGAKLLDILIFDVHRENSSNSFFKQLYTTLFLTMYYGLFRVGEVAESQHMIKAGNVFIDHENRSAKFVLYTSKTHGRNNRTQEVIVAGWNRYRLRFTLPK